MAKFDKAVVFLLTVVLMISLWLPISECSKKPVGAARKEDIPYIKCQVCEKLALQLYQQVQAKQAEISPKKVIYDLGFGLFYQFVLIQEWVLLCMVEFSISVYSCAVNHISDEQNAGNRSQNIKSLKFRRMFVI